MVIAVPTEIKIFSCATLYGGVRIYNIIIFTLGFVALFTIGVNWCNLS